MKKIIYIFSFFISLLASPVQSGENLVVAELFTSQGCMACPPANKLLTKLDREDENLLVLSWSVDYWDYLGWQDTFAKKSHTDRQADYNESLGKYGVFTPQIIINGRRDGIGSREELVHELINKEKAQPNSSISTHFEGDHSNLTLNVSGPSPEKKLNVRVVYYSGKEIVQVAYGDNTNKTLGLTNVVMASSVIAQWSGGNQTFVIDTLFAAKVGADCIAILIQEGDTGPIISANKINLATLPNI